MVAISSCAVILEFSAEDVFSGFFRGVTPGVEVSHRRERWQWSLLLDRHFIARSCPCLSVIVLSLVSVISAALTRIDGPYP